MIEAVPGLVEQLGIPPELVVPRIVERLAHGGVIDAGDLDRRALRADAGGTRESRPLVTEEKDGLRRLLSALSAAGPRGPRARASTSTSEAIARCASSARRNLCGGPLVRAVPTATVVLAQPTKRSDGVHPPHPEHWPFGAGRHKPSVMAEQIVERSNSSPGWVGAEWARARRSKRG
jgi:hypothetical protein